RRCQKEMPLTLAACCDTDPARAEAYAKDCGFAAFETDYIAMLEAHRPDGVLITTPFTVTPRIASEILRRGTPCLIEKPPAETLQEMLNLVACARETGSMHQVAYNRRHMPLIRALKEWIQGERVQAIDYQMHRVNRKESFFHTTAVHGFDLVSYLAGNGLVEAAADYQSLGIPGVMNANFLCRYESGVHASLRFAPVSAWICEQVNVVTDAAYYQVDLPVWGAREQGGSLLRYQNNAVTDRRADADFPDGLSMYETNGFYEQLRAFLQCVSAGARSPHTLDTGVDAAVLEELMRTRTVRWNRGEGGFF
ncbi:MAG TPA: Gfo/Idh/MocA family oxidoreductase, partial [Clostridia bacterium]|nr:Gfo/Idh/MocA family oxidoreductase [Clostridia bacterium]